MAQEDSARPSIEIPRMGGGQRPPKYQKENHSLGEWFSFCKDLSKSICLSEIKNSRPQSGPKPKPSGSGLGLERRSKGVGILFRRNKRTSEQSELCSDVVTRRGFEPRTHCLKGFPRVVKWYFKNSYKIQKRRRFFAPMCFTPVFPSTIMLSVQQAADRMRAAGEDGKP